MLQLINIFKAKVEHSQERLKCIHNFNGKSERKKFLGLPRHRWKVKTKISVEGVVWVGVDWSRVSVAGFF
jgi:hypothetical protein